MGFEFQQKMKLNLLPNLLNKKKELKQNDKSQQLQTTIELHESKSNNQNADSSCEEIRLLTVKDKIEEIKTKLGFDGLKSTKQASDTKEVSMWESA